MNGNDLCDIQPVIMLLIWGWIVIIVLMGVGRRLGNVGGTFNCRFEAMGNKVYFDIMKLLLPFCIFEFEVIVLMVIVYGQ